MRFDKFISRIFPAAMLLCCLPVSAQQAHSSLGGRGAEGTLTVTMTIVPSVGVVVGPDGEQRLVYANSVDPRDNVSRLQPVVAVQLTPATDSPDQHKSEKTKKKRSTG
jgi:hypothetical protein